MKKASILAICGLIGLAVGYIAAPLASVGFIQYTEPDMFGEFLFAVMDSSVACNCDNQPSVESLKILTSDLASLERWRDHNPNSRMLGQEIGLTEIRLSKLDEELGNSVQADEYMKQGQAELGALGWRDLSGAHLVAVTTQLNSEYKRTDHKAATVASTH